VARGPAPTANALIRTITIYMINSVCRECGTLERPPERFPEGLSASAGECGLLLSAPLPVSRLVAPPYGLAPVVLFERRLVFLAEVASVLGGLMRRRGLYGALRAVFRPICCWARLDVTLIKTLVEHRPF
jgi:hypothetical protein